LNATFEAAHPLDIIRWAAAEFGDDLVMSSSFGAQAAVLIHMANTVKPGIKIIFIDTGYLFPETHRFMEELRARFNLNVWIYRTREDPFAYLHNAGEDNYSWRKDIARCCAVNKNEPMERAMRQLAPRGWLRGIRRDQAETRRRAAFVEWSTRYNCWAISPLLAWSGRDVGRYMKEHDLPWHPLVEKGYLSIGCSPLSCTRCVKPGESERAGRWAGTGKLECGINSLDSASL